MAKGHIRGEGGCAWQERWPLQQAVCTLLECILVYGVTLLVFHGLLDGQIVQFRKSTNNVYKKAFLQNNNMFEQGQVGVVGGVHVQFMYQSNKFKHVGGSMYFDAFKLCTSMTFQTSRSLH